jgi:hypothetical protein
MMWLHEMHENQVVGVSYLEIEDRRYVNRLMFPVW